MRPEEGCGRGCAADDAAWNVCRIVSQYCRHAAARCNHDKTQIAVERCDVYLFLRRAWPLQGRHAPEALQDVVSPLAQAVRDVGYA